MAASFLYLCHVAQAACFNDCQSLPDCEAMGYKKDMYCPYGYIKCPFDKSYKWCKEYKCADGRYTTEAEDLSTKEIGYRCDHVDYHGLSCYHCYCAADTSVCKWNESNKGTANLTDGCCDGWYKTCTNTCKDTVTVPKNATGIQTDCTGCDETKKVITAWQCNEWYDELNGACYARPCSEGYSITEPNLAGCGDKSLGSAGWTWESKGYSGPDICGKCTAKACEDGYNTNSDVHDCGYFGTIGASKIAHATAFSGDSTCYRL